jgi:hypothetical protein
MIWWGSNEVVKTRMKKYVPKRLKYSENVLILGTKRVVRRKVKPPKPG